ncbi:MAG: ABC transporter permease, partial [Gammaproteobacteria bacterium]
MNRNTRLNWINRLLLPLLNVATAFAATAVIFLLIDVNPIEATKILLYGAFGYEEGIGYTLYYATNFIFTGLAVAIAFHAGLFNIGGEGQAYI